MAPSSRIVEMDIYSSMYKSTGFLSFAERGVLISEAILVEILEVMELHFSSGFDQKIVRPYMRLHDKLSIPAGVSLDRPGAITKEAEFLVEGIEGVIGKVEASEKIYLSDAHRPAELILPSFTTSIVYLSFSYDWSERGGTRNIEGKIHALSAMPPLLP